MTSGIGVDALSVRFTKDVVVVVVVVVVAQIVDDTFSLDQPTTPRSQLKDHSLVTFGRLKYPDEHDNLQVSPCMTMGCFVEHTSLVLELLLAF